MSLTRDNSDRARFAFLTAVTYLLLLVVQILLISIYYVLTVRAENGLEVDEWEADFLISTSEYISHVGSLIFIISIVSFIMWLYRMVQNVMIKSTSLKYTPLMTIVCWFIPFYNIFGPIALMNDVRKNINALISSESKKYKIPVWIIAIWWPLHLFRWGSNVFLKPLYTRFEANDEIVLWVKTILIENLLFTAGGIFVLLIIRSFSKAEERLLEI